MLIGFCGRATAGKTTAAQILIEEFGFQQAKFAGSLKEATRAALGVSKAHTDGDLKNEPLDVLNGASTREFMEWIGEGARERFGATVWVNRWFQLHGNRLSEHWVFDDVRNPDEADAIKQAGGVVIRIYHDKADGRAPMPSEKKIDLVEFDIAIKNDMTARFGSVVRGIAHGLIEGVDAKSGVAAR